MCFMAWDQGFKVEDAIVEDTSMQFSAFFPGLGKEFHYLLHKMGLTIGSVLEINLLGQIYASKVVSIPAVKILGDKGMVCQWKVKYRCNRRLYMMGCLTSVMFVMRWVI